MLWIKKNKDKEFLNSKEYESVTKKLIELYSEIEQLKVDLKVMETNVSNLRGNFNAKLTKLKKGEVEEPEEEKQTINNPVILPFNGSFPK